MGMIECRNIVLGAGIAGLGVSYSLNERKQTSIILEEKDTYGGLCGSFEIQGFTFDRFVHLSFTNDERVKKIFEQSSPEILSHIPHIYNIYNRMWIKHPVQNNLYPLSSKEKQLIIDDFIKRPQNVEMASNYEEWLRIQFGDYFAEYFPMVYTKKYWMHEAKDLRTEWVGMRIYQPSIEEVIQGSQTTDTPVIYYAKEMRYPLHGGYKAFLRVLAQNADIRCNEKVIVIDAQKKLVVTELGTVYHYSNIYSSIPLPEMVKIVRNVPDNVKLAASKLEATCGYHISIALKTLNIPPYLWWYIYDEDVLGCRVYSPSVKSFKNVPRGCSSLQMEVYCKERQYSEQELYNRTVRKLIEMNIIRSEDIIFTHVEFEKYANIIFTEPIYRARKIVREYMETVGVKTIGRFGEWDYLWSDQSLLSGMKVIDKGYE